MGLLNEFEYAGLPFAIPGFVEANVFGNGAGGEEAKGMVVFEVAEAFFQAAKVGFVYLAGGVGVNADEVVLHDVDLAEHPVDHDFVVGADFGDFADEHDAVDVAEGVVGDGDEGLVVERAEDVDVVDAAGDAQSVDHGVFYVGAGEVFGGVVDAVYFVEAADFHDAFHDEGLGEEGGNAFEERFVDEFVFHILL